MTRVVGRLAPSPTGLLHLGHARSFLLAWWSARSAGGRVVLRLDDLDTERAKDGLDDACLRDLAWLGLDWDGPVARQTEHAADYEQALARLTADGRVYPCVCTRAEIERAQSAPHLEDGTTRYPGTCRGRFADADAARAATGREPALRFAVEPGVTRFVDVVAGEVEEDVAAVVGDFPVARRGGEPAYQLAVVVDDAVQGVTEVVRGDDLLSSTARQRLLHDALGLPPPRWAHVPLVTDEAGRRLAKRHDDLALAQLREAGVDPRRIVAWAARSAGLAGEHLEAATPAELLPLPGLAGMRRAPFALDAAVLRGLAGAASPGS